MRSAKLSRGLTVSSGLAAVNTAEGTLTGSVYLNQASLQTDSKLEKAEAPAATVATAYQASDMELEFWRSVKNSNRVEELNAYITNYLNGAFKSLALTRISELQGGPAPAPSQTRNLSTEKQADQVAEDQIGLDRGQRRDVQRRLNKLGFGVRVTGKFDDETRGSRHYYRSGGGSGAFFGHMMGGTFR